MNKPPLRLLLALCVSLPAVAQSQGATGSAADAVFRDPFTLNLRIDKKHYYKQDFPKIPYVVDNDVYLFAGESFGIAVMVTNDEISSVSYQSDASKADVWFNFFQDKKLVEGTAMMLVIQNKLRRKLFLDALMTVPQGKGTQGTSILPVAAGLTDYESWPHPIVQLVLRNFRLRP